MTYGPSKATELQTWSMRHNGAGPVLQHRSSNVAPTLKPVLTIGMWWT